MVNLVEEYIIRNAIDAILEPYSSFPNSSQESKEEAWKRYFNAHKIISEKLSFFFSPLYPIGPVATINLTISRMVIGDWETFESTIKSGIQDAVLIDDQIALPLTLPDVDSIEEGAKNFYQFWLRFFYLCLNFETINYASGSTTAVCTPVSSETDNLTAPVPFNVSHTASVIKNIVDKIIKIEDNKLKIKYHQPFPGSCIFTMPNSLDGDGYFLVQDFTPEECYLPIIINSIFRNFFSRQNFIIPAKIISFVQANTPIIPNPNAPTNSAAPAFVGIAP